MPSTCGQGRSFALSLAILISPFRNMKNVKLQDRASQLLSAEACSLKYRPEALYYAQQAQALLLRPSLSKRPVVMGSHLLERAVEVASTQLA